MSDDAEEGTKSPGRSPLNSSESGGPTLPSCLLVEVAVEVLLYTLSQHLALAAAVQVREVVPIV